MSKTFDAKHLAELESLLGARVPVSYLSFLDAFPPDLRNAHYAESTARIVDHELHVDAARIVELNRSVRSASTWGANGEQPWPNHHLAIGRDLSGDVVFVDLASGATRPLRYLVEDGRTIAMADDVASLARRLAANDPTLPRS